VQVSEGEVEEALNRLAKVFGVAWFAASVRCASRVSEIVESCVEAANGVVNNDTKFAIRAHRSYKQLGFSSGQVEREAGEAVQQATGAGVDLSHPDVTIYAAAAQEGTYVYTEKIPGPGGLPVGTSGKALALLSGGFDSIAAAYYLAKRGAHVDFLHFHAFPNAEQVLDSKITGITRKLSAWTQSERLYLASYFPFESRVWELDEREQRYELVVFRRLMARTAEALAGKLGYQAIILGDSLGQVASQTMENIAAVDEVVTMPVFRPLIGMDKVEVVQFVRDLGLYEEATADYKDCCSIIARNPAIKANMASVHALEEKLGMDALVAEMVGIVEEVAVGELREEELVISK
jgi:thiamine biosynthesis protein ThiI